MRHDDARLPVPNYRAFSSIPPDSVAANIPYRPTPLEIASGAMVGLDPLLPELPDRAVGRPPRRVLEDVMVPYLERSPCVVSFSGGRDSSAVLAVATLVARREGLNLPIPCSLRFPKARDNDESSWQELLVRHLELDNWLRPEFDDELDMMGPVATSVLRRHGVLTPFNAFFIVPALQAASGGSLLTGVGGDELLSRTDWERLPLLFHRMTRPHPRDLLRAGVAFAPRPLRRAVLARRQPLDLPWLRPRALREFRKAYLDWIVASPVRWDRYVQRWWWRCRYFHAGITSFAALGRDHGVLVGHPLGDPDFLASLAAARGAIGFNGRTRATRALFGDVLPNALVSRPTKGAYRAVFIHRHTRDFVRRWSGEGVDPDLVDPATLRGIWTSPNADAKTFLQLQAAWMATEGLADAIPRSSPRAASTQAPSRPTAAGA